jgi:hypothetical protein
MPWEIRQGTSQCSGYGVFKEGTSELEGCHTTREAAQRQMAALYASEPEAAEKEVITSDKTPNKYPQSLNPKDKRRKRRVMVDTYKSMHDGHDLYSMLTPEEKAFHDALVGIAEQYGPFDQGTSSIWVGYETPDENEDAAIGVKCGNCSFHYEAEDGGLGCKILSYKVQENAKCRLAAIPDGLVNPEMAEPTMNRNEMQEFVDDMMERIGKADNVRVGEMVSWNSSGGRATGKVTRVIRNGKYNVPNSDFTITGTPDDPAVAIRLYRDGEPTDTMVGHKMSTLRRVGKSMNPDLEKAMDIINSLTKAHHDMKEEAKAHNMDEEKSMHEDEEDEEMQAKGYKDKKNKSIDSDSAQQTEVPADLSSIFTNMPRHAKRVNTTGNAPVNFTFLQGDK